jgi:tyrosyl-tRNA synthetase
VSTPDEQLRTLTRDAVDVLPAGALERKLGLGRPLRVKLGLDPTAGDVTLGWAVPLRRLRTFQRLGHQAVLIVGDFTARIGDPSEKASTRKILSKDEVDAYAQRVLDQFFLILDRSATEVRHNSEWLEPLGVEGFLDLASYQTVAQTLQRDDFAQRYATGSPLSLREFVYPLLQGYDSVAVDADIEIGGTDQLFNLLVGRDLQRAYGREEQVVITNPLIEGTDGAQKMSQSVGNYIAITEAPDDMFGKLMRLPDHLMEKYLRLTTDLEDAEIARTLALPPQEAKRRLGEEVVKLYHGADAAATARARFDKVFVDHETPDDVPVVQIPADAVDGDGNVYLPRLLASLGLASSSSEGRRLIRDGGVHIDDATCTAEEVAADELRGTLLRVGKRRFVRLS